MQSVADRLAQVQAAQAAGNVAVPNPHAAAGVGPAMTTQSVIDHYKDMIAQANNANQGIAPTYGHVKYGLDWHNDSMYGGGHRLK